MGWIWSLAAHHRHFLLCGSHWTAVKVKILLDFLFCCMFSAKLNFRFDSWTWALCGRRFFNSHGPFCKIARCKWSTCLHCLTFVICFVATMRGHVKRHPTRVWSEDSTLAPNETEEWWHTATMCWQNWPTPKLPRWSDTPADVFNPPAFQNEPLRLVTHCRTFHLPYFFTVRESQHWCLLELASILGTGWAILTAYDLPKKTKLGKGDNPPSFFCSISWPAFSLYTVEFSSFSSPRHHCAPVLQMWFHFLQAL